MNDVLLIFELLVAFQIKHVLIDFFLQNKYMLGKFNVNGWFAPLMAHTSMHGLGTLLLSLSFGVGIGYSLMLALCDIFVHTVIDKTKVEKSRGLDPKVHKEFWWHLGIDQMFHHLTHYLIIFVIIMAV